ncbi:MAG: hypothetical protein IKF99_13815 [Oscillospiraceae bacterium]|nr:hypothetical protein [Oscillospiraceae bacterium]MBR4636248.1 hypothetical protein [Clostridia bacterium]
MSAEYSANAVQTVPANGGVIFTESPVPCNRGMIYHRDESALFQLASPRALGVGCCRRCCCQGFPESVYGVSFHANIAVPTDPAGTVEEIQLAIAIDGEIDPSSIMSFTPAAAGVYGNVGADVLVSVPCICGCSSVSVRNISAQPINVQNANLVFSFDGIRR